MAFIHSSEQLLKDRQDELETQKNGILSFLQERAIQELQTKNIMIQARVKGTGSLREKIIRRNYFDVFENNAQRFVDNLPDLIGVRVICLLEKEQEIVFQELDRLFNLDEEDGFSSIQGTADEKPYLKINKHNQPQPQKNKHKLYKLDCQWITDEKVYNVELQIKSLVHMFWGEIEHMLFYKNYAYTVSADFYKNFMNSTYEILRTVDYQLDIIKQQLSLKTEEEQISEIKQMMTRLIYNTYQPVVSNIYGCELDLKEVYEMLVHMYFQGVDEREQAFSQSNTIIGILNSNIGQLKEENYSFGNYEALTSSLSSELKELARTLDELAKGHDAFWKTLFAVHKLLFRPANFTRAIDDVTGRLMAFFDGLSDEFDEGLTRVAEAVMRGIKLGLSDSFSKYRKLDFFSPVVHQQIIYDSLVRFINVHKGDLLIIEDNELDVHSERDLVELIKFLVDLEIGVLTRKQVTTEELSGFNTWLDKESMIWLPNFIDREKLLQYIADSRPLNRGEFDELFEGRQVR